MSDRPHELAAEVTRQVRLEAEVQDLFSYLRIANLLHDSLEPEKILETVLSAITSGGAFGFDRAMLLLVEANGDALQGRVGVEALSAGDPAKAGGGETARPAGVASQGRPAPRSAALTQTARRIRLPLMAGASAVVDVLLSRRAAVLGEGHFEKTADAEVRDLLRASCIAVAPIVVGEEPLGVILADNITSGRPIGPRSVELLGRVTTQAGHALERARSIAFAERERARANALKELAEDMLVSTNLERVLQTAVRVSSKALEAARATLWLQDPETGKLRPSAVHGVPANATAVFTALEELAREAVRLRRTVHAGGTVREVKAMGAGALAAPITVGEESLGALAIAGRPPRSHGAAAPPALEEEAFLEMAARLASLAIVESRLTRRALDAEKSVREARTDLVRTEKLAALGELVTRMAQDIREPLRSIGALAKEAEASLGPQDANRARFGQVVRQAERLSAILDESLRLARPEPPRLRMKDLNELLREATASLRDRIAERKLKVTEHLAPDLPQLLLDHDKVLRAIVNIVRNAVENTPPGGKVLVESRADGGFVECAVANEGTSTAGDLAERLFAPFATREDTGGGLGFAVSSQIVRDHGGEIRVAVQEPWAAVFSMRFPVRDNGDRRKSDRRGRDRRRAA